MTPDPEGRTKGHVSAFYTDSWWGRIALALRSPVYSVRINGRFYHVPSSALIKDGRDAWHDCNVYWHRVDKYGATRSTALVTTKGFREFPLTESLERAMQERGVRHGIDSLVE